MNPRIEKLMNITVDKKGPNRFSPISSQPITWKNAQLLLNMLDGFEYPPLWKMETAMNMTKIGPSLVDQYYVKDLFKNLNN
jgi:hypothetical protein